MLRLVLAILLSVATGERAVAQEPKPDPAPETAPAPGPGDTVKAMVGTWEFTNSGRDKLCTVRFRNEPTANGMKLEFDPNCVTLFDFLAGVSAWTIAQND